MRVKILTIRNSNTTTPDRSILKILGYSMMRGGRDGDMSILRHCRHSSIIKPSWCGSSACRTSFLHSSRPTSSANFSSASAKAMGCSFLLHALPTSMPACFACGSMSSSLGPSSIGVTTAEVHNRTMCCKTLPAFHVLHHH